DAAPPALARADPPARPLPAPQGRSRPPRVHSEEARLAALRRRHDRPSGPRSGCPVLGDHRPPPGAGRGEPGRAAAAEARPLSVEPEKQRASEVESPEVPAPDRGEASVGPAWLRR